MQPENRRTKSVGRPTITRCALGTYTRSKVSRYQTGAVAGDSRVLL
jgi:hypothetical protein